MWQEPCYSYHTCWWIDFRLYLAVRSWRRNEYNRRYDRINKHIFNWLVNKKMAFCAMIVVSTWQMAGYMMIVYIAGLEAISDDVIEAAEVDGAGFWRTLINIKLPLIMSSITICLFLTLSNCFKIYDVNVSLTGGGPNNSTEMVSMNIFNEIFTKSHFGYGQAKAIVFFVIIALITLIQVKITGDKEVSA